MSELFGYLLIDKHLFVWLHVLFGIAWIGLLYYFNFIQGGYFKVASPEGLADAKSKLAPEALWWFRWAAMFTFLTGLILLHLIQQQLNNYIAISALMGTLMFLNVWLIIWPNQKIALGLVEGDGPAAASKALLASRTNTLFSAPMLYGMFGSSHYGYAEMWQVNPSWSALTIAVLIILIIEFNSIYGKLGPMTSVKGVIHSSFALTIILYLILYCC